jgi:hypothetical protein
VYPLGPGSTFKVTNDLPKPLSVWKRVPAAVPERESPYRVYLAAPAPESENTAPNPTTESQIEAKTAYDHSKGPYDGYEGGYDNEGPYYEDYSPDDSPGYDNEGPYYEDYSPDDSPGDYNNGYDQYYNAVRGRADVYKGVLTAFGGPGSHEVKCGKAEFVADFIDSDGTVRCPEQPTSDPKNYIGSINGTLYDSNGAVPLLKCGSYEITLVKGGEDYGYEYRGEEKY